MEEEDRSMVVTAARVPSTMAAETSRLDQSGGGGLPSNGVHDAPCIGVVGAPSIGLDVRRGPVSLPAAAVESFPNPPGGTPVPCGSWRAMHMLGAGSTVS